VVYCDGLPVGCCAAREGGGARFSVRGGSYALVACYPERHVGTELHTADGDPKTALSNVVG
jgi:hypothetical protein